MKGDATNIKTVEGALKDSDAAVHAIGMLYVHTLQWFIVIITNHILCTPISTFPKQFCISRTTI